MIRVIAGPRRCGKSALAEEEARLVGWPVTYVGTLHWSVETAARIERHRATRPAEWQLVEAQGSLVEPLAAVQKDPPRVVLLDGLAVHVAHCWDMEGARGLPGVRAAQLLVREVEDFILGVRASGHLGLIVTNNSPPSEVPGPLAARILQVNERVFALADEVKELGAVSCPPPRRAG